MLRAAVCIGIDRIVGKQTLKAAAESARKFAEWAQRQGCDTRLLTDTGTAPVTGADVFKAVAEVVKTPKLEQLIIYFSGHGALTAPDTEFWFLSDAGTNPNECINLNRSIADVRLSGVPHVIFVSDACRSAAEASELGAMGLTLFSSSQALGDYVELPDTEVDVFFATKPGKPAFEAKHKDAVAAYQAIFSVCLLEAVKKPAPKMVNKITRDGKTWHVVPSVELKPYLLSFVPKYAASFKVTLHQSPEIRHESRLPKFFGQIPKPPMREAFASASAGPLPPPPDPTFPDAIEAVGKLIGAAPGEPAAPALKLAREKGLVQEIQTLMAEAAHDGDDLRTGFTFRGARPTDMVAGNWEIEAPYEDSRIHGAWHVGLETEGRYAKYHRGNSLAVSFEGLKAGVSLPILPHYLATVVVNEHGVQNVSYAPSRAHRFYGDYLHGAEHTAQLRAFAALATDHGEFKVADESAINFAMRTRQDKLFDPMLGVYAAYSYAQVGRFDDVASILDFMVRDNGAAPFDVLMLALFSRRTRPDPRTPVYPLVPMLRQGWSWLRPGDPLHSELHEELRRHILPGVWTTIDPAGMTMIRKNSRALLPA